MSTLHRHKTPDGLIATHGLDACAGEACPIHKPSLHHMLEWPLTLSAMNEGNSLPIMVRECPHELVHPDPDSLAYFRDQAENPPDDHVRLWYEMHGLDAGNVGLHLCDGCCQPELGLGWTDEDVDKAIENGRKMAVRLQADEDQGLD